MAAAIKFGPAGSPESFYDQGHTSSLEMPQWLNEMGLNAFEYQCGRGVKISSESATRLGELAIHNGIALSVHSPYFINISTMEPDKYENKTVRFKCNAVVNGKIPAGCFIVGRHMMTCCADDIQFAGLVCEWEKARSLKDSSWMVLTAHINFRRHKAYSGKGPVLGFIDMEYCQAPEQPVATF